MRPRQSNGSTVTPADAPPLGVRRRVYRAVMGKLWCDECGNPYTEDACPYCRQRRPRRGGLEGPVETFGGGRVWVRMERDDEGDGGRWYAVDARPFDADAEGWSW